MIGRQATVRIAPAISNQSLGKTPLLGRKQLVAAAELFQRVCMDCYVSSWHGPMSAAKRHGQLRCSQRSDPTSSSDDREGSEEEEIHAICVSYNR